MGIWIRQGTASCDNGSTAVSGGSTPWNAIVRAGDGFHFIGDDEIYEISADADANAAIAFVMPYAGENKVNAPYEILPISIRRQEIASLTLRVDTLLQGIATLINTTGKPADTVGANGTLAVDQAARIMYKKTDGAWDNGTSLGGPGYGGTSTTSQAIQTGTPITFAFPDGYAWAVGGRIRAIAVGSDPLAWMEGDISAYDAGELSFTPTAKAGSGTYTDWTFAATGAAGAQGDPGNDGDDGVDGWSPILALAADGEREVLQVIDWTGGTGTKPETGKYIGPSGFVVNTEDAIDIKGPQGDQGDPGETGPASLTWTGPYDDETTYQTDDVVTHEGSAWRAKTTTIGNLPPSLPDTSNDYFEILAAKGDQGDQGDPGEPGNDGQDGTNFSPNAVGNFADRSSHDAEAKGFVFLSLDGDGDTITTGVLFFKQSTTSGDWSSPVLFQGPAGPAGLRWIDGEYDDGTAYAANDALRDQNAAWRCIQPTTGGHPPPTLPTTGNAYWQLIAGAGVSDYNDLSNLPSLGSAAALDVDTDSTLAADSDEKVASQKAVKTALGTKLDASALDIDPAMEANSGSRIPAQSAVVAYVATKIAALVDSSPATLDTFKELADALGDDPNFATTVMNALGARTQGPESSIDGNIALFNGVTGKALGDSGIAFSTDGTLASNSDEKVPTEKAVKAYVDDKAPATLSYYDLPEIASPATPPASTMRLYAKGDGALYTKDPSGVETQFSLPFATGSFTPQFTFATPGNLSITYANREGKWTRIGDLIFMSISMRFTPTFSTASGTARIVNLPFTFDNLGDDTNGQPWSGSMIITPLTGMAGWLSLLANPVEAQAYIALQGLNAGALANIDASKITSGTQLRIGIFLTFRAP